MEALQNELKWKDSLQLCDFSTNEEEATFYHSHSMKNKPYLSLKLLQNILCDSKISKRIDQVGFYRKFDLH